MARSRYFDRERVCGVCSRPLPPPVLDDATGKPRAGRPRLYCAEDERPCGVFVRALSRAHSLAQALHDDDDRTPRTRHALAQRMAGLFGDVAVALRVLT